MCGRYTLRASLRDVARAFGAREAEDWPSRYDCPRYNIAPTQDVPAVRSAPGRERQLTFFRWGLVPSWADSLAVGARMINARAETVATKSAFRRALVERRCVIPCDGFYEWRSIAGRKQPFHISLAGGAARAAHGGLLPLAGLWDLWRRDGQTVESCAIITTAANSEMAQLHDRMPAILTPEALDAWLDPDLEDPARLAALLRPYEGSLAVREANRLVNSPRNDSPACLAGEQGMFD